MNTPARLLLALALAAAATGAAAGAAAAAGGTAAGGTGAVATATGATAAGATATGGTATGTPAPAPAAELASRLAGTWYELAHTPAASRPGCASDIVERYLPRGDGSLTLHRSCLTPTGRMHTEEGHAWPAADAASRMPRLTVSFLPTWLQWLPLRRGNVALVMLDPTQRYAVLAAPRDQALWLLSRSPTLPPDTLREIVDQLAARGYPAHRLVLTHQSRADAWLETELPAAPHRVRLMVWHAAPGRPPAT